MYDPDDTVRLDASGRPSPPAPAPATPRGAAPPAALVVAGGVFLLAVAGAGAWWWLRPGPAEPPPKPDTILPAEPRVAAPAAPPAVAPAPGPAPVIAPAPTPAMPLAQPAVPRPVTASEDAIREHRASEPTLFALAANPRIFVADFPDLDSQAAALNRVAALIEKAGAPRDRVLDNTELAAAVARSGETAATYYYGHNYRGSDIERFFVLAERGGIGLTREERWLRDQVSRIRADLPAGQEFAVVSVPGIEPRVDASMRRAILHHELGHGYFFTNPAFAAHVARVWRDVFTEAERARFRAFLQQEGYDPTLEDVMLNEAMAYLVFTPDPRFFTPAHVGMDEARAEALRAALRAGAPM